MSILKIDKETCNKCGACIAACAGCIIIPQKDGYPRLFPGADDYCLRCGHCVGICPMDSVIHQEIPLEKCPPIDPQLLVSFEQASQLIRSRRAIREFREEPVPREVIQTVIDVARYAPTGHNIQEVQWLVIDDAEELRRLTAIGVDWFRLMAEGDLPWAGEMPGILKMHDLGLNIFLRDAPAVVMTYAEKENPIAATDCPIALAYFNLAAQSLGLGCCWGGFISMAAGSFEPMINAVGLPEGCMPYGTLMVGYPKYEYRRIPTRKPARITWR